MTVAVVLLCGVCVNRRSWRGAWTEVHDRDGAWTCAACERVFTTGTAHVVLAMPPRQSSTRMKAAATPARVWVKP